VDDSTAPHSLVFQLRRHFVRHNVHVVLLSLATLVVSIVLWLASYAIAAWLTLLLTTIVTGMRGQDAVMPASFLKVYLALAGALLLAAIIRRALIRDDLPRDKRVVDYVLDVVLAIPAATVQVWSNLSAWLWLSPLELAEAAGLLERIVHDKRLPVQSAPIEIPDDTRRDRILLGLLMTGLLRLRREKGITYLRLASTAGLDESLGSLLRDGETPDDDPPLDL